MARKKASDMPVAEAPQAENTPNHTSNHEAEAAEWFDKTFPTDEVRGATDGPLNAGETTEEIREATDAEWLMGGSDRGSEPTDKIQSAGRIEEFAGYEPWPTEDAAPEPEQPTTDEPETTTATLSSEVGQIIAELKTDDEGRFSVEANPEAVKAIADAIAKPKPEVKEAPTVIKNHREFLVYKFSEKEVAQAAQDLAAQNQELRRIQENKDAVNAQFATEKKECEAKISKFASHVREKQEHRYVDCRTTMNTPRPGEKTTIRLDTYECVGVNRMSSDECQQELPFSYPAR